MGPSCGQGGHSIASGQHSLKLDLEPLRITFILSLFKKVEWEPCFYFRSADEKGSWSQSGCWCGGEAQLGFIGVTMTSVAMFSENVTEG